MCHSNPGRQTRKKKKQAAECCLQGICSNRCLLVLRKQQWQVEDCCKHKTEFLCAASKTQEMQTLERMSVWVQPADGCVSRSYWTISRLVLSMHTAGHGLLPVGALILPKTSVVYFWETRLKRRPSWCILQDSYTTWSCNLIYFIKCWLCTV